MHLLIPLFRKVIILLFQAARITFNYRASAIYLNQDGIVINTGKQQTGCVLMQNKNRSMTNCDIQFSIDYTQTNRKLLITASLIKYSARRLFILFIILMEVILSLQILNNSMRLNIKQEQLNQW